jgi:hypothetical protein
VVVTVPDDDTYVDSAAAVAADHPLLVVVPMLTALLAVDNVRRVAAFSGTHVGVSFPTPSPIVDVWAFVSVPQTGVTGPSAVPLLAFPVYVVLRGVLAAGYLGSIDDALADRDLAPAASVKRYALPLVGFAALQLGLALAVVPLTALSPVLLVPALLGLLAAGYLFYGTPYLVVTADEGLVDALEHSYRLATSGGAYGWFFLVLAVGGAVLSTLVTAVVVNLGLVGVLLGTVLVAPLGVVVNAAATALFRDLARRPDGR